MFLFYMLQKNTFIDICSLTEKYDILKTKKPQNLKRTQIVEIPVKLNLYTPCVVFTISELIIPLIVLNISETGPAATGSAFANVNAGVPPE